MIFVGLGLGDRGISLAGLDVAKEADVVYAELYTSMIPGLDLSALEGRIGQPIKIVDRNIIENLPDEILQASKEKVVALLVPGDPMTATTHIDLRLRAARAGIETRIIHGASIISAAAGLTGLQGYKFGPSVTIPFPDNPSARPYEVLAENRRRGLHTLLLLDLRSEEGRAMSANEAMDVMLGLEERFRGGFFTPGTLAVVVARAGSADGVTVAERVDRLRLMDFGPPPHVLIVPGGLHFVEAEALKVFAGAPEDVVG